jgi:hypothetical protein
MQGESPVEIHKQIGAVYGDIMYWQNVTECCCELCEGRIDVHNEQRSGRASLISVDLVQESEGEIRVNQQRIITGEHHITTPNECDREITTHKLVHTLDTKILTDDHKIKQLYRTEVSHVLRRERRSVSGFHCDWRRTLPFSTHS